jgi:hypothetical protein
MKMALCIVVSQIITFSPLGARIPNYTASVQEMPMKDCVIVKKAVAKVNHVICEEKK